MIPSVRIAGAALAALACLGADCGAGGPFDADADAVGEIRGVVTADGTPRAGVTVTLRRSGTEVATVTSAAGAYEFSALSPGVFVVSIADLPGMQCVNAITATVVEGEGAEANFLCTTPLATGTVSGRVTENGFGAAGIVVALKGASRAIPTDQRGAYRFTDVPSGSETVEIGLPDGYEDDCPATSQEVTVPAGGTVEADFECTGQVVMGRVTLNGTPWPAVVVLLCGFDLFDSVLFCDPRREVTDSEGRYAYTSLRSRTDGYFWDGLTGSFVLVEPPLPEVTCPSPSVSWGTSPTLTLDIPCQGQ